jgi:hypothetical protein
MVIGSNLYTKYRRTSFFKNFISNYFTGNTKIKWSEISESLQEINPNWIRSGKQCRERYFVCLFRWLNHLCSSLQKSEDLDHNEIQQLLNLMREHGKKW